MNKLGNGDEKLLDKKFASGVDLDEKSDSYRSKIDEGIVFFNLLF